MTADVYKRLARQPNGAQQLLNICCCCSCCCQVLKHVSRHAEPAALVTSPFLAHLAADRCVSCGVCVDRCPMGALSLDDRAVLDAKRCIGCGLCVSTCSMEALTLTRKPEADQHPVPRTPRDAALRLARERGKLGNLDLAMTVLKSKLDRLLA